MTARTRGWLIAFVMAATVSGAVIGVMGQVTATPDIAASVWAQGLTASDRAAAGRQFYSLPPEFRKALLRVQTGTEKSVMSRTLVTSFLAVEHDLTPEQHALMEELYNLLTPEFCSVTHDVDQTGLGARIMRLFPKEEAWLFVAPGGGVIGPQKATSYSALPLSVQAKLFIAEHLVPAVRAAGAGGGDCDCDVSEGNNICIKPIDRFCSELDTCSVTWTGCGIFHLFSCHNICSERIQTHH